MIFCTSDWTFVQGISNGVGNLVQADTEFYLQHGTSCCTSKLNKLLYTGLTSDTLRLRSGFDSNCCAVRVIYRTRYSTMYNMCPLQLAKFFFLRKQLLHFQRCHTPTASTGDCLSVPFILDITSSKDTFDRGFCGTRYGDDVAIRVSL